MLSSLLQCPGAPQCHCCGSTAHAKRDCSKVHLIPYEEYDFFDFSIFRKLIVRRWLMVCLYKYAAGRSV